jgi:hypothetical protein
MILHKPAYSDSDSLIPLYYLNLQGFEMHITSTIYLPTLGLHIIDLHIFDVKKDALVSP